MVAPDMADLLKTGLGFGALPTSAETLGMSTAIIAEFALGVVSHAPGTVTGTAPGSGGPLIGGAAAGGLIAGMTPASLAANMQTFMGKPLITPELLGMATGMVTHFLLGLVGFSTITGVCGNSATSPGPLVGEGSGGLISGYDGTAMATLIATAMGKGLPTFELVQMCTELVNYIMSEAEVTYVTGQVTGTCSAGGGPIAAGAGVGGVII
jgi:hypothetical protein